MNKVAQLLLFALSFIAVVIVGACGLVSREALAQVTCISATSSLVKGKITTKLSKKNRPTKCLSGEVSAVSGPAGADGQMRVYGDGSAGALVVNANGSLFINYAVDGNIQFSSLTVPAGRQLIVASGTILRVTGDVTINGIISVSLQGLPGKFYANTSSFSPVPVYQPPSIGIASAPAVIGQIGTSSADRLGGLPGFAKFLPEGLQSFSDTLLLGGGGGAPGHIDAFAGFGGGSLMIVAGGTVTIASGGGIQADAFTNELNNGSGGGGGGIVAIAAKTAIVQAGTIWARGSDGNSAGAYAASGGGGGGGLILLASPTITTTGANLVNGGSGGQSALAGTITQSPRIGGGGGGASVGNGGIGAAAKIDGSSTSADDGGEGKVYKLAVDPTALL